MNGKKQLTICIKKYSKMEQNKSVYNISFAINIEGNQHLVGYATCNMTVNWRFYTEERQVKHTADLASLAATSAILQCLCL